MTDLERQEILRRHNEGMRAMSDAQMAVRAAEQAEGMRQRGALTSGEQDAMRNLFPPSADMGPANLPPMTFWQRATAWLSRLSA